MRPEEDGSEELQSRLRAELDALPRAPPRPAQARYQLPPVPSSFARRFGPTLAGAAAAILVIGSAAAVIHPSIFNLHSAGARQNVRPPDAPVVPAASASPTVSPHSGPTQAEPEAGSPEPQPETSEKPESSPEPEASPTPSGESGSGDSSASGDGGSTANPSPSPTDH